MRGKVRRKIEMGSRAVEFDVANASPEAGHESTVRKLKEGLARAEQLGIQQRNGQADAQAASARRVQVRSRIEFGNIAPLVKVGRLAAQESLELIGKFRMTPTSMSHKAFLIAGRAMLAEAMKARDLLQSLGLAANLIDDFAKALDQFETEGNTINESRRSHITARAELDLVANSITDLVNVLDGFNRYRFAEDAEQLAAWNAARSVVAHSPRKSSTPPADGGTKAA